MTGQLLHAREQTEEANRKLVQHEKLASIGRMAATIAHEIRNPLTSVKLNIQKIAEEESFAEDIKAHLGLSLEGIDQIERFIKELLNFTRGPELSLERWSIEQIVEESLKVVRDVLAQKKIVVETSLRRRAAPVHVDGDKMRQVFLNVLRNAHEALEAGGKIGVSCDAVVEGEDEGPGPDLRRRPASGEGSGEYFRAVLHDQALRLRARPGQCPEDRRAAQRDDPDRQEAGEGERVRHTHPGEEAS